MPDLEKKFWPGLFLDFLNIKIRKKSQNDTNKMSTKKYKEEGGKRKKELVLRLSDHMAKQPTARPPNHYLPGFSIQGHPSQVCVRL
jgi:hypothetical protein